MQMDSCVESASESLSVCNISLMPMCTGVSLATASLAQVLFFGRKDAGAKQSSFQEAGPLFIRSTGIRLKTPNDSQLSKPNRHIP